jgi:archaemetzincin
MRIYIYSTNMIYEELKEIIKEEIGDVEILFDKIKLDLKPAFNKERNQYNALKLFDLFGESGNDYYLLIIDEDIFVPAFNYCFGVAYTNKGIVSTARLKQSFYGLEEDPVLFQERLKKEVMHELGHMLGLSHCKNKSCVMYFSNSIEDTDRKSYRYCNSCKRLLGKYRSKSQ